MCRHTSRTPGANPFRRPPGPQGAAPGRRGLWGLTKNEDELSRADSGDLRPFCSGGHTPVGDKTFFFVVTKNICVKKINPIFPLLSCS